MMVDVQIAKYIISLPHLQAMYFLWFCLPIDIFTGFVSSIMIMHVELGDHP